ncbi:DUF4253 domain-containing protein [Kitasatospora sp. NPDC002551]|uniref:DUF4253 domain-containing protein n=1 Tax=unclassified Kitasatospora TaxID=2633591 RepID=UPI00331D3B01
MIESPDLAHAVSALPVDLPSGRLVAGDEGEGHQALMWVSDDLAPPVLWGRLHRLHPQSGLWPLLLSPLDDGPEVRPWLSGELFPDEASELAEHDPAALLSGWWAECAADEDEAGGSDILAPYGSAWPGLAPATVLAGGAADTEARDLAEVLQIGRNVRLGLVRAGSGAEALAACGWSGPVNHENDSAKIAAVLADWERRFGAQVVEAGFSTLELSVPVPPATLDEALPIAAEHMALCPDQVLQGAETLTAYAEQLIAARRWSFWWD